jgi:hypothetical protein
VSAFVYRGRPLTRLMAEEAPASQLPFVVPFEARTRHVGADYVRRLAELRGSTFVRNPPDVGILASLDDLAGPAFRPARAHPLIREFYEHTSHFKLSIVPEWRPWMKPAYELFKRFVAQPLGQAAIPSNIEEVQRGMVSTIDTIDLDDDEIIDIRGWIRTFADSGEPIYVGIYTSFRHEDRATSASACRSRASGATTTSATSPDGTASTAGRGCAATARTDAHSPSSSSMLVAPGPRSAQHGQPHVIVHLVRRDRTPTTRSELDVAVGVGGERRRGQEARDAERAG